jgi:hypothetical protein
MPLEASGRIESHLDSWRGFAPLISEQILPFAGHAIWRGQSSAEWALETSFDRAARKSGVEPTETLAQLHLQRFKRATRGRRTPRGPSSLSDDEWWTLGQHYGLVTPLLDWTYSPYVALYFAFSDPASSDPDGNRAVWLFNVRKFERWVQRKISQTPHDVIDPGIRILDPLVDENARLVNQNGLFTRLPVGLTVDAWAKQTATTDEFTALWKLIIPDKERDDCLRHLNQMNINHVTLFPDLDGASRHCNNQLTIQNY